MQQIFQRVKRSSFDYYKINSSVFFTIYCKIYWRKERRPYASREPFSFLHKQSCLTLLLWPVLSIISGSLPAHTQSINPKHRNQLIKLSRDIVTGPVPEIINHPCYIYKNPFFSFHPISNQYMDPPKIQYQGPVREVKRGSILHLLL